MLNETKPSRLALLIIASAAGGCAGDVMGSADVTPLTLHRLELFPGCSEPGAEAPAPAAESSDSQSQMSLATREMQEMNASFMQQVLLWMVRTITDRPELDAWSSTFSTPRSVLTLEARVLERDEARARFALDLVSRPTSDCAGLGCTEGSSQWLAGADEDMSYLSAGPAFARWTQHVVEMNPLLSGGGPGIFRGCDPATGISFERTFRTVYEQSQLTHTCTRGFQPVDCLGVNLWPTGP